MADLILSVDTALAEVPVNKVPLIDDTDFKSLEEAIAFNAAGMDLIFHFITKDGAYTATPVTPTAAGDYDWAHQDGAMYTIEIPASGGASINNDTEGFGWFTGVCTGVLPWRGPTIHFAPANIVDSWVDGSDKLEVDTTLVEGSDATDQIRDAVVDDATRIDASALNTAATAVGSDGSGLTEAGGTGDHLTAVPWNASWDAEVESEVTDALTSYDPPTRTEATSDKAEILAVLGTPADADLATDIATIDTNVDTLVSRITSTLFAGITSLAEWLGQIAGKQAANATAQTEIRATGAGSGTYDATTDSQEAIRDNQAGADASAIADAVWDEARADHTSAGTFGEGVKTEELNTQAKADVNAEVDTALSDYDGPTKAELDTGLAGLNDPTVGAIADAVWDETQVAHTTAGTFGEVASEIAAILTDTGTTLDGKLDAIQAVTDNLPDSGALSSLATASALATVDGNVDSILVDTDTTIPGLIAALNDPTAAAIVTAIFAHVVENSLDVDEVLRIILAASAGKLSGAATTTIAVRDTADSKDRITATVDADGNRTAVTLDGS